MISYMRYTAGIVTVKAIAKYNNVTVQSNTLNITIAPNPIEKRIVGYEQLNIVTKMGVAPLLPNQVLAHFDQGFDRKVPVTWDTIPVEKYAKNGRFTVTGTVANQALKPTADVVVRSIAGVQKYSTATPLGMIPQLPDKAKVYYTDGSSDEFNVNWEAHSQSPFMQDGEVVVLNGTVGDLVDRRGNPLTTQISIRVSSDTHKGDNFTGYKNGFYLPLGIASFT